MVSSMVVGFVGFIWPTVGGLIDLKKMYKLLNVTQRDDMDDGWVVEDQNLADSAYKNEKTKSSSEIDEFRT